MVASETIRLMEEHRGKPWFLGAGFYKPHCPWIAPSKYFGLVPLDKVKLVPFEEWEMKIALSATASDGTLGLKHKLPGDGTGLLDAGLPEPPCLIVQVLVLRSSGAGLRDELSAPEPNE